MSEAETQGRNTGPSFPAVFAGLMILWPVMAILGAQGYAPLLGLTAIAALLFRPGLPRPSILLLLFIVLVTWISATTAWSPARDGPILSGNLSEQNFAIEFSPIRLIAISFATLIVFASIQASRAATNRSSVMLVGIFAVHLTMVLVTPPLLERGLAIMYETQQEALRDGMQNVLRFATALALALPALFAFAWTKGGLFRIVGILGIAGSTIVFALLGNAAGILAVVFLFLMIGVVMALPRNGFRLVFAGLAAGVMAAPALGWAARMFDSLQISLPLSFQSRIWAWQTVSEKIAEKPLLGHGLEAASTWRETYAIRPDWLAEAVERGGLEAAWSRYPLVPSHPHNMPLEIWVETGAIGAVLAAATLIAFGWRLPQPSSMPLRLRLGVAGLIGAVFAISMVSYSAWNEAFWASVVLVAIALIVLSRAEHA